MAAGVLDLVDIEELVKDSAAKMLDGDAKKKADLENPEIDWDSANFSNDTPKPQRYTLRTERRTKSTCNVALNKTYTVGASIEIKLTPPNPIIEANAGFHGEMSMEKGVNETFEQELAWTVDNEIEVPPGHMTKADLVIKEDEFDGEFTIESKFEGKVVVTYETKKQREHVATVVRNVKSFLNKENGFKTDDEGRPCFVTKGKCKCRFGIEQNVLLKQTTLPSSKPQSLNGPEM
nr:hypothetical protein BaRGS_001655 [Batillaria attramentaria]